MTISFDARTGQFHNETTRRFIPRDEVLALVDAEIEKITSRLQGHARLAIGGKISTAEFQVRFAQTVKESHLFALQLGSGGRKQITKSQLGATGRRLQDEYTRIARFGRQMSNGELSEKQILARAAQYGESIRATFHDTEKRTRAAIGFNQAKRDLDPGAQHCPECLQYSDGLWKAIAEVTSPSVNCSCGGKCRCRISYRRYVE